MGKTSLDSQVLTAKYLKGPPLLPPFPPPPLPTNLPELDALLPGGGLPRGAVSELVAPRGLGLSTALALSLCGAVQQRARAEGHEVPWCAFLDPTCSLHAAGVEAWGVDLSRLLVARPPAETLTRASLRVAQSKLFSLVVVDTAGLPGAGFSDSLGPWVAMARRLASAVEGASTVVLLLTHREMARPLPLPVSTRVELTQERPGRLLLRLMNHRYGLPSDWQPCALRLPSDQSPLSAEAS